ncbi:MAG TPA: NAD(P)H-quinone oxidoreductase [Acidimicrobiales bacterium]
MRAVVLEQYGDPDVLQLQDVPDPVPGPDEVVVEIVSTSVNRPDLLQRRGRYPQPGPRGRYEIPGLEFAGVVIERGARAGLWNLGDEVMGITAGGGHAERIAVHERQLAPVPVAVGARDAGVIPEVWITAWDALVLQGGLRPGDVALVHAGGSGVGTAAIQIAKAVGATVVATASSGKVAPCVALGADHAVDYATEDFVAAVEEISGGRGADVVLDVVGGDYLDRNLAALATRGRLVQVGTLASARTSINLGALMTKRATLIGTLLRPRPIEEKIAVTQRFAREVLPWFESGVCRPVIDRRFPLDKIAEAHRVLEANANVGKIAIDVKA